MVAAKVSSSEKSIRAVPSSNLKAFSNTSNSIGCVIASGTSIEGQIQTEENIRLDGILKGSLSCNRRLVIGRSGQIDGSVWAREADISGIIEGDLQVEGLLVLKPGSRIGGKIIAKTIQVESGAIYNGNCKIG